MPISRAQMPKQLTGGKRKKKLKRQENNHAIAINMKKRGVKPKGETIANKISVIPNTQT